MKFNNLLKGGAMALALGVAAAPAAVADDLGEPLITFHTNIYETYGATNQFSLVVGGEAGSYIDVDCGFGPVEYEIEQSSFDSESGSITGVNISCQVSKEGIVRIYGEKGKVDYFNADGCYISNIEFSDPETISIMTLCHNELETLDLSAFTGLQAFYINDNPFDKGGLKVGPNKPKLLIIEMNIIDNLSADFNLSDYPALMSFDGMNNPSLKSIDPTGCPNLMKLSIDATNVQSVDVSKNPYLCILNISDTPITDIDVTNNPELQELYCTRYSSVWWSDRKISRLDVSKCPKLFHLFAGGNNLTSIDVSNCTNLNHLWLQDNQLTELDLSKNVNLNSVRLEGNCFNFNTLPLDPGTWNEYEYKQRDMEVPRSYKVGTPLDFTAQVIREDSPTYVGVFSVDPANPGNPVELGADDYTFENGVVTINAIPTDSVYVAFANTMFPTADLATTLFKVKSAEDFGKDDVPFTFETRNASDILNLYLGIDGASAAAPKQCRVEFADGSTMNFDVTSIEEPLSPNLSCTVPAVGKVKVYVPEGSVVTAIAIEDIPLTSIDVTALITLRTLRLDNTQLPEIDLQWNRCLTSLIMRGNDFGTLSLRGNNNYYGKNVLYHLDLSNNNISDFQMIENVGYIGHFDLSHNNIKELNFTDCEGLRYVDVSYNELTALKVNYCCNLKHLDASHNYLTSYIEPETNVLESLVLNDNNFALPTLPVPADNPGLTNYVYAPQHDVRIPVKAPGVDVSAQNLAVGDAVTSYSWLYADTNEAVAPELLSENNGATRFDAALIGSKVYCQISHPAFPDFAGENILKTNAVEVMGMPTHEAVRFHTTVEGETATLSLSPTVPMSVIYIDWNGDGTGLEQYVLEDETTYKLFEGTTRKDRDVSVLTYDEIDNIRVFSVAGASMSSFDASNLTSATCLSLYGAGDNVDIKLPKIALTELTLDKCGITEMSFKDYPELTMLSVQNNPLTTLDLTGCSKLGWLTASNCNLENIIFPEDCSIWSLDLPNNNFSEIDLSGVPELYQMALDNNKLSHIDLSKNPQLRVVSIASNYFDFSTLPLQQSNWNVYTYGNQAAITPEMPAANVVDLSHIAKVGETESEIRWWIHAPTFSYDTYDFEGEELVAGDEYTIENGVTTFSYEGDDIVGTITNSVFPSLRMFTTPVEIVLSGIDNVTVDNDADTEERWFDLQGRRVEHPAQGRLYIRTQGTKAEKILVK